MDQTEKMRMRQEVLFRIDSSEEVTDETVYREIDHVVLHSQGNAYRSLKELIRLREELFDAIRGFDVLEKYLRDEAVTEIMVIGPDKIFVEKNGVLESYEDDYCKLASPAAKAFFSTKKLHIGSTGNLGLSVGLMGKAIGYEIIVHMSSDAAEWKKELLRSKGVIIKAYEGDYVEAVSKARAESEVDANGHFVDDEDSKEMFLGYAVAGKRLKFHVV